MGTYGWKQHFIYQVDYQHWANEVLFESLGRLDPPALAEPQGLHFSSIHRTMDHILVVAQLWRLRLQGESPAVDYQRLHHPDWRELVQSLRLETRELQHWLETKPDVFFESEIAYRSSEGKERRNWVRDVLTHMMSHMVHHRGQVSAVVTRLGVPAPEMDYIYYKRAIDAALAQSRKE
ncbi:MAG TPA: DinB family protein [Candidatus Desulfobacillus sp.]|nr:DinB family protein [Candidatus Desulfobacillus sp.]